MFDGRSHQLVVAGVKLDQVNAVAKAVMGVKFRLKLVGQVTQFKVVCRAGELAKGDEFGLGPPPAFALHGLFQGHIGGVHVVVAQLA